MPSHVVDMLTIGNSFGTPEMRAVWDERNRLQKQLDVEGALARAEAALGIIPAEAADAISGAADAGRLDVEALAAEGARTMHSLNATVSALQRAAGEHGEWVHYGVTTQDVVDTATVLQVREGLDLVQRDALAVARALKALAVEHRDTPMTARTHAVQALPTTFGFKVAVWLDEFVRHLERLAAVRDRVLTGNVNGAVGTYSAFGETGPEVERATLELLGLNVPNISWQSARDRISEYAAVLTLVSGSLGKIAGELTNLMRTEIGETEEPFAAGKIGSTTMPHKRNPALLEGVAALTNPMKHAMGLTFDSMNTVHERDAISWRAEWISLPELHLYLSAQLGTMARVLPGLVVNKDAMARNLHLQGGLLLSEKVMFEVGRVLGKQTAHQVVYDASMTAVETGRPLLDVLREDPRLDGRVSAEAIAEWLDPLQYLGAAGTTVDRVVAAAEQAGI
ncbi:adenylosuccinate lyase [Georgenia subflava]|uniref:Adenylosuccinate lyase n=1 Tax=Georgenia subflava TaxID=1622177 RepID=A0A6N7EQD9_9MICO|nr:adenylosuccinate lyase [Georgenia subflava]MPV39117.1 adenylosuccinate lyase [Georgenia subflava]